MVPEMIRIDCNTKTKIDGLAFTHLCLIKLWCATGKSKTYRVRGQELLETNFNSFGISFSRFFHLGAVILTICCRKMHYVCRLRA